MKTRTKIGALLITAALLALPMTASADPECEYTCRSLCGDVDGDFAVTASDALRVLMAAVGTGPELECQLWQQARCDLVVNEDE